MPTGKSPSKSSKSPAENLIPPRPTLSTLKEAAADCRACDLWKRGTQTVPYVMATVHPSSVLRAPDDETRRLEHRHFVDDLKKLARVIK